MRRRDFTMGLSLAAAARAMRAQEPARQHRIAIVISTGPVARVYDPTSHAFQAFGRSCTGWAMPKDKT